MGKVMTFECELTAAKAFGDDLRFSTFFIPIQHLERWFRVRLRDHDVSVDEMLCKMQSMLPYAVIKTAMPAYFTIQKGSAVFIRIHQAPRDNWPSDGSKSLTIIFEVKAPKPVAQVPKPKKVIFNNPATIVIWEDGTKTVVKCQEPDSYDSEKGLALCYMKKALGNTSRALNDALREGKGE